MTPEYIVLGVLLIIMGGVQTWLRHGPGWRDLDKETADGTGAGAGPGGGRLPQVDVTPGGRLRSGRRWNAWTAVMGGVGIVLGIVLVVMGVLGR